MTKHSEQPSSKSFDGVLTAAVERAAQAEHKPTGDVAQVPQGNGASSPQRSALQPPPGPRRNPCANCAADTAAAGAATDAAGSIPANGHPDRRGRKSRTVYDPYLGSHPVPRVDNPALLEAIVSDDNIIAAAKAMLKEPGKSSGVDRKTVRAVCKPIVSFAANREDLRNVLKSGRYRPGKVLVSYIPKGHGEKRKLGIAIVQDRLVQRMILQAVGACTPDRAWSDSAVAYRQGKDTAEAIERVNGIIEGGYEYAVRIDLKAFFDNVPHHRLMAKLHKHIADKRVVRLIRAFVTPVMCDHGNKYRNRKGTPQGSVIAPWLASMLYLDEFDREMERRGHPFVRYADDIVIFCHDSKAADRTAGNAIKYLERIMECPVNRNKTVIVPTNRLAFLGLVRRGRYWDIPRRKQHGACGKALKLLGRFAETGNIWQRDKACQKFEGMLRYYERIPGLAPNRVPALRRWFERKLLEFTNRAIDRLALTGTAAPTASAPGDAKEAWATSAGHSALLAAQNEGSLHQPSTQPTKNKLIKGKCGSPEIAIRGDRDTPLRI